MAKNGGNLAENSWLDELYVPHVCDYCQNFQKTAINPKILPNCYVSFEKPGVTIRG